MAAKQDAIFQKAWDEMLARYEAGGPPPLVKRSPSKKRQYAVNVETFNGTYIFVTDQVITAEGVTVFRLDDAFIAMFKADDIRHIITESVEFYAFDAECDGDCDSCDQDDSDDSDDESTVH